MKVHIASIHEGKKPFQCNRNLNWKNTVSVHEGKKKSLCNNFGAKSAQNTISLYIMKKINYLKWIHCEYLFPNSGIKNVTKMKKTFRWHYVLNQLKNYSYFKSSFFIVYSKMYIAWNAWRMELTVRYTYIFLKIAKNLALGNKIWTFFFNSTMNKR